MWINFDQLLDLPNVTVGNYQKIAQTIFLKLALLNETIECPNCHQTLQGKRILTILDKRDFV